MTAAPSTSAEILFVCTGNVARSPYLENRLRLMLAADGIADITVASAGTHALVGHEMAGPIVAALEASGVSSVGSHARALTAHMLDRADLILTAERAHTPEIARLSPAAVRRTFTALQLARLLSAETSPGERGSSAGEAVRLVIQAADRARGAAGRQSDEDDVPDPWRRPPRTYRRSIALMDRAVGVIADRIARASPSPEV